MTTDTRDLRTGRSVWQGLRYHSLPLSASPPRRAVDVAIVGAGVSGALLAERLAAAGLTVAVFDRRGIAQGSTAASTALILLEIDTPLVKLGRKIGRENAARVWRRTARAVDDLARRVRDLGIACDLRRRSAILLTGDMLDADGLEREAAARQAAGIPTRLLDRRELASRLGIAGRPAALDTPGGAELNPVKLTAGLLRRAVANGATLHAPVEIVGAVERPRQVELTTADGGRVTCKRLVYASGYEVAKGVPKRGVKVISTWSMATRPQPSRLWPGRELIWEAADSYLYIRTTADGRVIAGGEDEDSSDGETQAKLMRRKVAAIQRKLGRLMPRLDVAAEYCWAGDFAESDTGLPTIGPLPGSRRRHAVLASGGNGITFSVIAADLVAANILGEHDADAPLFAGDAKPA